MVGRRDLLLLLSVFILLSLLANYLLSPRHHFSENIRKRSRHDAMPCRCVVEWCSPQQSFIYYSRERADEERDVRTRACRWRRWLESAIINTR